MAQTTAAELQVPLSLASIRNDAYKTDSFEVGWKEITQIHTDRMRTSWGLGIFGSPILLRP